MRDHTGAWHRADLVVLCTGAARTGVAGAFLDSSGRPPAQQPLRKVRLQMLLGQRLDGSLTIGDTHAYDEPFPFDLDEAPYRHLLQRAEQLLGSPLPPVRRRWTGVYSQATGADICLRGQVAPGVELVTGPGGKGMTLAPAIAEQTFARRDWHPEPLGELDFRKGAAVTARISVACLDMAGTTVTDEGSVLAAFRAAMEQAGLTPESEGYERAAGIVRATMGQSKTEVFRRILGDEAAAAAANSAFEESYARIVRSGQVSPLPGAVRTLTALRDVGIRVCLATGFSPATRDAVLDVLGWRPLIDLALSPADAGRGRPWPDLPLTALLRLGGGSVSELAVAGDTASDVESGLRAGAGMVAGVLTGSASREDLLEAGAPHVLDSINGLLPLLGIDGGPRG